MRASNIDGGLDDDGSDRGRLASPKVSKKWGMQAVLGVIVPQDDGVGGVGGHVGGMGIPETQHVPCKFDRGHLHTQADAKEGKPLFTGVFDGRNLSFRTPVPETR